MPMDQTTLSPPALPTWRLKIIAAVLRLALWVVVAFWVLFGLAWTVLHGWIVPRIDELRPRLEIAASQALGVPVRIGQISARAGGLFPAFELVDVSLLDRQGREALRLPRVSAAPSLGSLLRLGFKHLSIENPELDIRRDADGKIYVAGLDISQSSSGNSSALIDWVFSQPELTIHGGTVRWSDDTRQVPVLALTQVDWTVRNPGRRHLMRLDATPPPVWGERFSLRGVFREPLLSRRAGGWQGWVGQLYGEFSRVDVSEVNRYASLESLGIDLTAGIGALRAWADVADGQILGGTADLALLEVDVRLKPSLQALALQAVTGRIRGRQLSNGFDLATEDLAFRTREGLQWSGGNVAINYTGASQRSPARGDLRADKLDLAALAQIANRLPLGNVVHTWINDLAPQGLMETLTATWRGALDAPEAFTAKGRVTQLVLAPQVLVSQPTDRDSPPSRGRPGIRGANVDFDLNQLGGRAHVSLANGEIYLPGVFEDPRVPLNRFSADSSWTLAGTAIDVQLRNMVFANADAQGTAQASWHTSEVAPSGAAGDTRFPGVLDLRGELSRGDGSKTHRYLPLSLPESVRHYVRDAVLEGALSDVKFRVKGELKNMPFIDPQQGEFRVSARVAKGSFAYVPPSVQASGATAWPALTGLSGELVFERASMQIHGATAGIAGLPGLQVVKAEASIPNLLHAAELQVNAEVNGLLTDALGFVNGSPLGDITGKALARATGDGTGDYSFNMQLPLREMNKIRLQGSVRLPGNDVQFTPDTPRLSRLRGRVSFSEKGFSVVAGQAHMLGGDIRLDGGTQAASSSSVRLAEKSPFPDASVVLKVQGSLSAEGLRDAKELAWAPRLVNKVSGRTTYAASVGFGHGGSTQFSVTSDLQGLALNLPAPLTKSAETALPVRVENIARRGDGRTGQVLQDQLSLSVGRLASVVYVRDVSGEHPRVLRGAIAVGLVGAESAPLPDEGVVANITLATADLDAWDKALSGLTDFGASSGPVAVSPTSLDEDVAASYLPTSLAIRAKELVLGGRTLHDVVLGGSREGLTWRANVNAAELNGYVEFRQAGGSGAGRVYARLSRLSLGPVAAREVEALLDEQPVNIPALDVVVEDLDLHGRKMGRVEIEAVNRAAGLAAGEGGIREWRLNKLNIIVPEATLTATGNWAAVSAQQAVAAAPMSSPSRARPPAERRRTVMNFRLEIADSGALLERFGMSDVVRRGKGRLEGQIAWIGSPLSLDYPSLNGQFNVNVESGQFLKAEPGIAKLLGVLNLQALPRRLTLDFRDVFSEGFAFDFVRGDVNINQGLAYTNNLQMKGVNAAVLMEGSADIARETQNLRVVVVPEINAGTASLIATAINPLIGLGTFLAQMILRLPLIQAATQEFQIDGTWANPKIVKVERAGVNDSKTDTQPAGTK